MDISQKYIIPEKGMYRISFELPDYLKGATVQFLFHKVYNKEIHNKAVSLGFADVEGRSIREHHVTADVLHYEGGVSELVVELYDLANARLISTN